MYVELHAASAFSFLDGASRPEALVDGAVALGYPALALLDHDGVYGAPRFHLAAKAAGIKAMAKGWPYDKAHAESSRLEYRCRHHRDELHEALTAEAWG